MLAVLLTFPLQFLPSLQILEKAARLERGHGTPLEARWRGEPQKRAPTGYAAARYDACRENPGLGCV
jgi:hypothetical protein